MARLEGPAQALLCNAPVPQPGTPIGGEHSTESPFSLPSQVRWPNEDGASAHGSQLTASATIDDTIDGSAVLAVASPEAVDSAPPPAQLRRINEEGEAVPGSQDSALASQAQQQLVISEA